MADNSDWLGACATKGKTASNTKNAANALACFRTIVLRLSFSRCLACKESALGEAFALGGTALPSNRFHFGESGAGRSCVALDVVCVPSEVALEAVFDVRRSLELVVFAGVDDEFR